LYRFSHPKGKASLLFTFIPPLDMLTFTLYIVTRQLRN
jgi:hypothetical protein